MGKGRKIPRSDCATASALEFVGDRWSLLIIRDYIFRGSREYNEFLDSREGISTNILADRLSWLAAAGILTKHDHPTNKRKFYYELTQKGFDLLPLIMDLAQWSWKHLPGTFSPPELKRAFKHDRGTFFTDWKKRARRRSRAYLKEAESG